MGDAGADGVRQVHEHSQLYSRVITSNVQASALAIEKIFHESDVPNDVFRTLVVGSKMVSDIISNKHVNEFIIAKKLDLTINQTRNVLYKLADEGLVSSIRKKDKKKGLG